MEPSKCEVTKLPDMVMCGDHSSFTKSDLNVKEKMDDDDKEKDKTPQRLPLSFTRISPTSSRTERSSECRARMLEAKRRVRSLELMQRPDTSEVASTPNRAIFQAALGSFRWPPYLVAVWVVVFVLTHALHCAVSMLEKVVPRIKQCSERFRQWTEQSWQSDKEVNRRFCAVALGVVTTLLYSLYCTLFAFHALALWAVEPLCPEPEARPTLEEPKVISYLEDFNPTSRQ